MGINMQLIRRVENGDSLFMGPVTLECSSPVAGPNPPYWMCNIKADLNAPVSDSFFFQFAAIHAIRLTKVNSTTTPACSVFQDGEPEIIN